MEKRDDRDVVSATLSGPEPADFPLQSVESRAAARAMLEERERENNQPLIYRAPRTGEKPRIFDYQTGLPIDQALDDEEENDG